MKKLHLFCLLLFPFGVWAQFPTTQTIPSFEISMEMDSLIMPDIFYLEIFIVDNKGIGKKGIEEAETNILLPTLMNLGIDVKENLVVSDYYSAYQYRDKVVMSKKFTLTVHGHKNVNEIVKVLRSEEIVVSLEREEVSNKDEIIRILQQKAIHAAELKVNSLLSKTGSSVQSIIKVEITPEQGYQDYFLMESSPVAFNENGGRNLYGFEKHRISAKVNIVFALVKTN